MDLIMLKNGEKEAGKRWDKAGEEGVQKEGVLCDGEVGGSCRARSQAGGSPLVRLGGRQVAHLAHRLLVGKERPLQRAFRPSRPRRFRHGPFVLPRGRPVLPRGEISLARHFLWKRKILRRRIGSCVFGRGAESARKKMKQWEVCSQSRWKGYPKTRPGSYRRQSYNHGLVGNMGARAVNYLPTRQHLGPAGFLGPRRFAFNA